jgi:hypothetical protein
VPAKRGGPGLVKQRVLVWLAVAIIVVIRVLYFPKGSLSWPDVPAFAGGLLALLAIGELTVRILDWVRRHPPPPKPDAVGREPVGPLLERLSAGDVVMHQLRVAAGLIEHLVFRADGVVFLVETHPASGWVGKQGHAFRLNGRPLPIHLFKRVRRKLKWLGNFLAKELRCTPRLQAGLVFPNAQVAAGYHADGLALLGLEHLQPWLDAAEPDDQFSKKLWPRMSDVKRELLACSKPAPQPMQALPFGIVLLLGAVWLALSALSAVKPPPPPPLMGHPVQPSAARSFDKIELEGLGGVPPRRLAIINGKTVRQGEWTIIKVAGRDVGIRCETILDESATIAIDDVPGTTRLHLRKGAGETPAPVSRPPDPAPKNKSSP